METGAFSRMMVTLIFAREFIVTGFRVIAASKNINIAAGWLGKIKTNLQFFSIIILQIYVKIFISQSFSKKSVRLVQRLSPSWIYCCNCNH